MEQVEQAESIQSEPQSATIKHVNNQQAVTFSFRILQPSVKVISLWVTAADVILVTGLIHEKHFNLW